MKIAIIGGGGIGATHADAYRAVGGNVVAVVEPIIEVAEKFSERYDLAPYTSLSDLLESANRPDAISICTPPFTHRELVEEALAAGIHILCEKPMAHTLEDAEAIYRATQTTDAVFATGYCQRFQPELEFMHALIGSGRIGTVRTFYNSFSSHQADIENRWFGRKRLAGGGVVIDTAIHSIDIFRYLCGEVVAVSGSMSTALDSIELEVEHTATLGLRSEKEVIGTINCSWKLPNGTSVVRVSGSAGTLSFDYLKEGEVVFESEAGEVEVLRIESGDRFAREVAAFLNAVNKGTSPRTGAFDGLVGLAVVTAVYRMNTENALSTSALVARLNMLMAASPIDKEVDE